MKCGATWVLFAVVVISVASSINKEVRGRSNSANWDAAIEVQRGKSKELLLQKLYDIGFSNLRRTPIEGGGESFVVRSPYEQPISDSVFFGGFPCIQTPTGCYKQYCIQVEQNGTVVGLHFCKSPREL